MIVFPPLVSLQEKRVRATQIELETKMWVKDEKLRQLKEIVCNREREEKARKAKVTAARNSTFNRSKSPPPKPSQPPVRLRHRRSRSTGGNTVWVDHKPTSTLKTGEFHAMRFTVDLLVTYSLWDNPPVGDIFVDDRPVLKKSNL